MEQVELRIQCVTIIKFAEPSGVLDVIQQLNVSHWKLRYNWTDSENNIIYECICNSYPKKKVSSLFSDLKPLQNASLLKNSVNTETSHLYC